MNQAKKGMKRKGFLTTELALGLALITVIGLAGVYGYMKMNGPTTASSEYSRALQVVGAVERAAQDNSGAYPVEASAVSIDSTNTPTLYNQMGGNVADLAGWTYECATTKATIVSSAYSSPEIASMVAQKVNSGSPGWSATADSGTKKVTMKRTPVTCN